MHVAPQFARLCIVEEFLGANARLRGMIVEFYVAHELPQPLIVEPCAIGFEAEVDLKLIVVTLEEDALAEVPARWFGLVENAPFLGYNLIAYHARIGNEL